MSVLPAGFALPPLPYLAAVLAAAAGVGLALVDRDPAVTERHVLGLAPWMAVGSCLHVLYGLEALPAALAPLAGAPTVYLTVAVLAGAAWLAALALPPTADRVPAALAAAGFALLLPIVAAAVAHGAAAGSLAPVWPTIALVAAVPLSGAAWAATRRLSEPARATGAVGGLAVFGHGLDGVSTAVGIDVLGYAERTPLSRWIIEAAGLLPGGFGGGWLFVLVKLALAGVVVSLFGEYVAEDPREGYLLLGLVAAVGLGPGAHNLLLFAVTAGG